MSLVLKAIASHIHTRMFNGEVSNVRINAREIVKLILTETCRRVLELQNGRAPPRKVSLGPCTSGPPRIIKEPLLHAGEAHANERKVSITDFSLSLRGTETNRLHPLIALLGGRHI